VFYYSFSTPLNFEENLVRCIFAAVGRGIDVDCFVIFGKNPLLRKNTVFWSDEMPCNRLFIGDKISF